MPAGRFLLVLLLTFVCVLRGEWTSRLSGASATDLPTSLSDGEFWQLTRDLSEPDGTYESENLVSNEMALWRIVPLLAGGTKPGGVYMGVGPEQNFSYMAAIRPRMAFITDIRRGNLHVLLLYKALFELSASRGEFVSRLFTRTPPASASPAASVTDLMEGIWTAPVAGESVFSTNLAAVANLLTKTHGLPLSAR